MGYIFLLDFNSFSHVLQALVTLMIHLDIHGAYVQAYLVILPSGKHFNFFHVSDETRP